MPPKDFGSDVPILHKRSILDVCTIKHHKIQDQTLFHVKSLCEQMRAYAQHDLDCQYVETMGHKLCDCGFDEVMALFKQLIGG